MVGKSQAPMFRGEKPGETMLAPSWSLRDIARHAVDFWLSTEDLPLAENRVTLASDAIICSSGSGPRVRRRPPGASRRRAHELGERRAPRRDRRRRVRRPRMRATTGGQRRRSGYADRPQQLPPVPTPPLPGRHLAARADRHLGLAPRGVRRPGERRCQAGRDRRLRPGDEHRDRRGRRAVDGRRARPGGGLASRTSSTPRAPPSTLFRCTRSTTPRGCAHGSWVCSRWSTGTCRWPSAARSTS